MSILSAQIDALLENETNQTANLANASALLNDTLKDINWVGFYLYDETADQLDLGPFQGKVACMHIKNGVGVCGTAFQTGKVLRVANVHEFVGHIACDSPKLDRFSAEDEVLLSEFVETLCKHL